MKRLNELTIRESIDGLKKGDFTSYELTKACFDQIHTYDEKIKAFVTLVEEDALRNAKIADAEIKEKGSAVFDEKPLLGIPFACKDNFSTKGVETTASSNVLKGYIPPFESTVTQKLKSAGAILLGKTNMDAFAHGSSTETSDFFKTSNPWDYSKVPGGSSGGSTAAVASNMCIFAIGSETAGSIRGPAAWCGVTGLKPTYGRVSRYGVVAMASSTDSPGPLTKNVIDSAYILKIIAGKDPFDATSSPNVVDDYLAIAKNFDLKGKKIGRPASYFNIEMDPDYKKVVENSLLEFEKLGAEIVDIDLMDPKFSIAVYTIIQRSEVSSNLARLTGFRYGHSRKDFGEEAKKRMMLGAYVLSAGYYDQYYAKAQRVRTLLIEDLNKAFEKVDFIVGPSMPGIALPLGASDDYAAFGELMDSLMEQSSIAGITGISVPCGLHNGMPVGLNIMGPMFAEGIVLGASHRFQEATKFHLERPSLK
jgi:aspartyl-tRNA(Asn)/glutamyl-tRNA(Gln) amidotransferase subunit A